MRRGLQSRLGRLRDRQYTLRRHAAAPAAAPPFDVAGFVVILDEVLAEMRTAMGPEAFRAELAGWHDAGGAVGDEREFA